MHTALMLPVLGIKKAQWLGGKIYAMQKNQDKKIYQLPNLYIFCRNVQKACFLKHVHARVQSLVNNHLKVPEREQL